MEEKKSDRISISTGITHEIKKLMEEARERIELWEEQLDFENLSNRELEILKKKLKDLLVG